MRLSSLISELIAIQEKSETDPIVKATYNWRGSFNDAFWVEDIWEEIDENDEPHIILSYK